MCYKWKDLEFLLWLSWFKTRLSVCEDAGSLPGLAPWVKDLASLHAVAQFADAAQIRCCCGCWKGRHL